MTIWPTVLHEVRMFFIALQFLTRVPVPAWVGVGFEPGWLNRCVVHFPLVGALVGAAGACVLWAASGWASPLVAALLTVTATVCATGAFHEDGLADTFDALGGHVPRERALEIMKDSRIGTYGAAALGLSLALRVALLAELVQADPITAALALVAAHVLGRAGAVVLMSWLPYAGDVAHAKAKPLAVAVPWRLAVVASICAGLLWIAVVAMAVAATPAPDSTWIGAWAASAIASVVVVLLMRRWLWARLGGYTGDGLGATEQLIEVAVLLVLCVG
ncbi:MAG: adenosylcobinamide-GDP ribazoletransferase [Burkholderiaceae bacterium]